MAIVSCNVSLLTAVANQRDVEFGALIPKATSDSGEEITYTATSQAHSLVPVLMAVFWAAMGAFRSASPIPLIGMNFVTQGRGETWQRTVSYCQRMSFGVWCSFGYHLGVVNGPLEAIAADLGFAGSTVFQGTVSHHHHSTAS